MPICKECSTTFKRKYGSGPVPTLCGRCKVQTREYKKVVPGVSKSVCRSCDDIFIITKPRDQHCQPCRAYNRRKKAGELTPSQSIHYEYTLSKELGRCILDEKRNALNNAMLAYVNKGRLIKKYEPMRYASPYLMYENLESLSQFFSF